MALAPRARSEEATWEYAVQLSAAIQESPPRIELNWPQDTLGIPDRYTVHRKRMDADAWGEGVVLPGTITRFIDTNVAAATAYEYQVVKSTPGYTGYGYLCAGIRVPFADQRGKVILVVDRTHAADLTDELVRLQQDLTGDGWTVIRRDVGRDDPPDLVRGIIRTEYLADPGNVEAVFLFGHVPVPHSGNYNVDGHGSRPMPADAFYGDVDGDWRDTDGDGIHDHNVLPSDVELQVGRVDFAGMPGRLTADGPPTFPGELELLRRYLNKDHWFRHGLVTARRRALVGDRTGSFGGEAFAAGGFRNFAALVGSTNIARANTADDGPVEDRWISLLSAESYLWAFGCGGGSYSSLSGLGTHPIYSTLISRDLVLVDARAVFTMMFGSWLGEWDSEDNIMRAVLATPTYGLTCSWSGRPHHFYHHMGLGQTVGYGMRVSQNNDGLYRNQKHRQLRGVHIALLGDPTLRLHPVAPPASPSATNTPDGIRLDWTASSESALEGYHVYRSETPPGPFTRLTDRPVVETRFLDADPAAGVQTYMVRAVKLEQTPGGSYSNASQGIFIQSETALQPELPAVSVVTTNTLLVEGDWQLALLTFHRAGETNAGLTVFYELSGTATKWEDYRRYEGDMPQSITIPAGASFAILALYAVEDDEVEGGESIRLTLRENPAYRVGTSNTVELTITDSSVVPPDPIVSVVATDPAASGVESDPGVFTFSRTGDPIEALTVHYTLGGTATRWEDYRRWEGDMPDSITLPAGEHSADLTLHVVPDATRDTIRRVVLTLKAGAGYQLGTPREATITLLPEPVRITEVTTNDEGHVQISWTSVAGAIYQVAFKPDLADPDWIDLSGPISATSSTTSWQDSSPPASTNRHYIVRLVAFE